MMSEVPVGITMVGGVTAIDAPTGMYLNSKQDPNPGLPAGQAPFAGLRI